MILAIHASQNHLLFINILVYLCKWMCVRIPFLGGKRHNVMMGGGILGKKKEKRQGGSQKIFPMAKAFY